MTYHKNLSCFDNHDGLFFRDDPNSCSGCVVVPDGEVLCDRFIIKELLQSGINNTVYYAEDILKGIDVVIKTADIGPHQEKIPGTLLKLEMDTYKNLFSPNIIRVYDLHYANIGGTELLILSMEYFGGQTFRQWLSDGLNNNSQREKGIEWFKNICHGIGAAHDADIIHLNINPENIFIKDDQLKISGFESSTFVRVNLMDRGLSMDSISKITKPAYMSPELFNTPHPDELTPAADVYSLGILLYELSHPKRRKPFNGSYSVLRDYHINVVFKKIETIDKKLSDIIARCLEKSPAKRYQTAWELLDALENKSSRKTKEIEDSNKLAQKRIDVKFQEIIQTYNAKQFNKTTKLIDEILIQEPEHFEAIQLQARLAKKYHQAEHLYNEIKQQLETEKKDINLILSLLKQAMDVFPEHPSGQIIQHKLLNLTLLYKNLTKQGVKAFQSQNWSEALQFFEQANKSESGSSVLKIKIEHLKKIKEMKHEIDENLKNGDLEKARRLAYLTDLTIKEIKHADT